MKRFAKHLAATLGAAMVLAAGLATAGLHPAMGGEDKVTICHAAGQEGTLKFVTLTISHEAAFGQAGHFFENGTPRAGHEQDYLGPCTTDTTTTDTTTTDTTTTTTTTDCEDCTITTICTNCNPPPPPPPPPPFKCPNGEPPIHGQDGNPGNDSCNPCDAPVNLERCPPPVTTTTAPPPETTTSTTTETTTTAPPDTTTTVQPTTAEPSSSPPAKPKPPKAHAKPKPKPHAKPKAPPVCPPGQPYNGRCGVQGSG